MRQRQQLLQTKGVIALTAGEERCLEAASKRLHSSLGVSEGGSAVREASAG